MKDWLSRKIIPLYPCANTRICPADGPLHRIHFTCAFTCIARKQYVGGLPRLLPGEIREYQFRGDKTEMQVQVFVYRNRKHAVMKDFLVLFSLKRFASAMNRVHDSGFTSFFKRFWTLMEVLLA